MSGRDATPSDGKAGPELKVVSKAAKTVSGTVAKAKSAVTPLKARPSVVAVPRIDQAVEKAIKASRRTRNRMVAVSMGVMVALPTITVGTYFAFFAADQFASEVRFSVRGSEKVNADFLGILSGASASGASIGDSYILQEFIGSRELVDRLEMRVGLRERYERDEADWWARAPADVPIEDFVRYWQGMVSPEFDVHTGIISVEVKAFTAEDAKAVAAAIVEESRGLVNRLSEQSRQDLFALAMREVQFAEERLRDARSAMAEFRTSEQAVDPVAIAQAHETMIAELDQYLVQAQAELAQVSMMVGPDAPSRRILENRITALKEQIEERRSRVAGVPGSGTGQTSEPNSEGLSAQLAKFEQLKLDAEFAQQAYASALASLEAARVEAKREQRYLATFVQPALPQYAVYPLRLISTALVFVGTLVLWAISALVFAAIRDHTV